MSLLIQSHAGNSGFVPITARYDVLAPNYDGDSLWDGADTDDDNDGVLDTADSCSKGALGWSSYSWTDYDSDGCRDVSEDTDDDNDGISDITDACSKGALSWTSTALTDYDSDGCRDSSEDADDDNDGITDSSILAVKVHLVGLRLHLQIMTAMVVEIQLKTMMMIMISLQIRWILVRLV